MKQHTYALQFHKNYRLPVNYDAASSSYSSQLIRNLHVTIFRANSLLVTCVTLRLPGCAGETEKVSFILLVGRPWPFTSSSCSRVYQVSRALYQAHLKWSVTSLVVNSICWFTHAISQHHCHETHQSSLSKVDRIKHHETLV